MKAQTEKGDETKKKQRRRNQAGQERLPMKTFFVEKKTQKGIFITHTHFRLTECIATQQVHLVLQLALVQMTVRKTIRVKVELNNYILRSSVGWAGGRLRYAYFQMCVLEKDDWTCYMGLKRWQRA